MRRKVSSCILGILFSLLLIALHLILKADYSVFTKKPYLELTSSGKFGSYLGLDEESVLFPLRCSTCALIGSSGHLLDSTEGAEIDEEHICVFRLGFSPTRGYERHVGSRTTARIVDSFRFYPFLRQPLKLFTGPYSSEFWFLFDSSPGDIERFRSHISGRISEKYGSQFLWFSRQAEKEIMNSRVLRPRTGGIGISSLWFATRIIEDARCKTVRVYGIPEPQICKKNLNVSIPSSYWDMKSADLCLNGVDASAIRTNKSAPVSALTTFAERKALRIWAEEHFLQISFQAPPWYGVDKPRTASR